MAGPSAGVNGLVSYFHRNWAMVRALPSAPRGLAKEVEDLVTVLRAVTLQVRNVGHCA